MSSDESASHSISILISQLKEGDEDAATEIWHRLQPELIRFARAKSSGVPKSVYDEDDAVLSAFESVFSGVDAGYIDPRDRHHLRSILKVIVVNKITDMIRRSTSAKRGGGRVASLERLLKDQTFDAIDRDAGPELVVMLDDEFRELFGRLRDDKFRKIAALTLQDWKPQEIAAELNVSQRTVQRKLNIIKKIRQQDGE